MFPNEPHSIDNRNLESKKPSHTLCFSGSRLIAHGCFYPAHCSSLIAHGCFYYGYKAGLLFLGRDFTMEGDYAVPLYRATS